MSRSRFTTAHRFLAILLSLMLVIAMVPAAPLEVSAATVSYPDDFTVSVTDGTSVVADAQVTLQDGTGSLNLSAMSGEDGVAVFSQADILAALGNLSEIQATCTVSKTGYEVCQQAVMISSANLTADIAVQLTAIAVKQYTVTASMSAGGKVTLNGSAEASIVVDENASVEVVCTPDVGYCVDAIAVEGVPVAGIEDENGIVTYTLSNVQSEQSVFVTFKEAPAAAVAVTDVFNSGDAVHVVGGTYVFKTGSSVSFSTDKTGMRLYDENSQLIGGGATVTSVKVEQNTTISLIQLRYADGGAERWYTVPGVTKDNPLRIVWDTEQPTLSVNLSQPNENGFYSQSFTFDVDAQDIGEVSGLATIEYFVTDQQIPEDTDFDAVEDTKKTQSGTMYSYVNGDPVQDSLQINAQTVEVTETKNNSDYVVVWVKVTDRAGNTNSYRSKTCRVNCTAPKLLSVSADGTPDDEAASGYYKRVRTATVVFQDRASSFDENKAAQSIHVQKRNAEGKYETIAADLQWSHADNLHTATITFAEDGTYQWSVDDSYVNLAGLKTDTASKSESGSDLYAFTVDTHAPTAEIAFDANNKWNDLLSKLTFGIWKNSSITATVTATDAQTEVQNIWYYLHDQDQPLGAADLEMLFESGEFVRGETCTFHEEGIYVVYARIIDMAGNTLYISSDGTVIDTTKSTITLTPDKPNENGIYNKDVQIHVDVREGTATYAGLRSVKYKVIMDGDADHPTQEEILYTFDKTAPAYDDLEDTFTDVFTVEAAKNNSDDVLVMVEVIDNAGNVTREEERLKINIDTVKADITLDGTPNWTDNTGRGYFDMAERTATIVLTDRGSSFDAAAATAGISITAVDAGNKTVENAYTIGQWTSNGSQHTATVTFKENANYTWSFSYTNKAGNALDVDENLTTGETETPFTFTVDDQNPVGTISIGENTWDKLLHTLTFGLFGKVRTEVTATWKDETSPVTVEYYKTDNATAMTVAELEEQDFIPYEDFEVEAQEQFVVYLRITDYAGNRTYISSDGYIFDLTESQIKLTPSAANDAGIYSSDTEVSVDVFVEETAPYSGIQSVEYWVENNGQETQRGKLYTFDYTRDTGLNANGGKLVVVDWDSDAQTNTEPQTYVGAYPAQADLKQTWSGTVVVDKARNNSCDVKFYVRTTDNAGNTNENWVALDIDTTAPEIDVTFDNNRDNNGNTYFADNDNDPDNAVRTATVVITERAHHFDPVAATDGISVTAVDAKGHTVEDAYTISSWQETPGTDENGDDTQWTATVAFLADANYTWSVAYADKAGNQNTEVDTHRSVAPFKFTVDTMAPTGTIMAKSTEGSESVWTNLKENDLTFGFWSKQEIGVSGTAEDATSAPIASVAYYKVKSTTAHDSTTALTAEELDQVKDWTVCAVHTDDQGLNARFDVLKVREDEQFAVYLKITDLAGNYTYIGTNGLIVDHNAPQKEVLAPVITVNPQQPVNGLYNGDVNVDITVTDPLVGGTYSGLKTVRYEVLNQGQVTQSGTLYTFEKTDPKQEELQQSFSRQITVDSALNNSNDVKIVVYAEDNAQNASEAETSVKIDVTDPTIDVTYSNNAAVNGKYYNADRTATIVITERNFDPDDVVLTITNTDGVIPSLSGWTKTAGTGNQDNTKWTATVTFHADGDYTMKIAYTDLAMNAAESYASPEFTIDQTDPVIQVHYDNNDVRNEKYFDAPRTATVVITEHNFDVSRVKFTQTASLNGSAISIPSASWSNSGDTHTATIAYAADGDYTFDVAMTDLAENANKEVDYGGNAAARDFVVDQTIEKPVISGVEDGAAYKGDVIPGVSFEDVNFDTYEVQLIRTRMGEKNVDVTEQFIGAIEEHAQGGAGLFDTFEKIVENDGIYTMTVRMTDKAGNEETEIVTFSINRFGSVYVYSDYLASLIRDGGQYVTITGENAAAITEDLVITEYNADQLLEGSLQILITRDGQNIDAQFHAAPAVDASAEIGESGWYQYVYSIDAENFAQDGVYRIALSSAYETVDSKNNESTSIPENSMDEDGNRIVDTMSFTVDTTAPEIRNVVNLEETIVNAQTLEVQYTIVDVGGLKSVEVILNGETADRITEFGDSQYNYTGRFTIKESANAQTVQIRVEDLAGNVTDTNAENFSTGDLYIFNDTVTVSTNVLVRWYANKPLFWGSIIGVFLLAGAISAFLTYKRRKQQ